MEAGGGRERGEVIRWGGGGLCVAEGFWGKETHTFVSFKAAGILEALSVWRSGDTSQSQF